MSVIYWFKTLTCGVCCISAQHTLQLSMKCQDMLWNSNVIEKSCLSKPSVLMSLKVARPFALSIYYYTCCAKKQILSAVARMSQGELAKCWFSQTQPATQRVTQTHSLLLIHREQRAYTRQHHSLLFTHSTMGLGHCQDRCVQQTTGFKERLWKRY